MMSLAIWVSRYRGVLVGLPLVFSLVCFKHETEADWLIWPMGVSIFIAGFMLRVWAIQHCSYRQKGEGGKCLATKGPYSFIRNPLYIGNILICSGATVLSELLWFVPVVFLWCTGIYSLCVYREEKRLLELYGESYGRYMSEVPRWLPKTLSPKATGVAVQDFRGALRADAHSLLILFPFIIKEILGQRF